MIRKSTNKGPWAGVWPPGYTRNPPAKILTAEFGARSRCERSSVKLVFCSFYFLILCEWVFVLEEVRMECPILWNWSYRLLL